MNQAEEILLNLLKVSLGAQPDKETLCGLTSEAWNKVMDVAFDQGVAGVAFEAVELMPKGQQPDLDSLMEWFGQVEYQKADYRLHKDALIELAQFYAGQGIQMMLLKGYGLSLDYPVPEHRPMGDIDIFLYDGNMPLNGPNPAARKGDEILRSIGCNVETGNPHHSQIRYKGLTIENHHYILDNDMHLSNGKVERRLRELLRWDRTIEIEGATVYLPSATFGALHLLRHSGGDFCSVGTSLRQVLDWGLFIKAHHDEIDFPELTCSAKEFNMIRWMGCLSAICVDWLGMDAGLFPCVEGDRQLVGRIVDDIFRPEFQGEIPPMKQLVWYGLAKTRRMMVNRWKYGLVYEEGVIRSWWRLGVNRAKNWAK